MTEKILFLTHTEQDGTLSRPSREALQAAAGLGGRLEGSSLAVGLFGQAVQGAADAVADCGASRFLAVVGEDFAVPRYASDAAAVEALVRAAEATVIVCPGSSRLARAVPGATQRLDGRIDTHVVALEATGGRISARRWYYRQRILATLTRDRRPWFLLADGGVFEAWEGPAGSAAVETVAVDLPESARRTRVVGQEAASAGATTIRPEAELLFVAGAGWSKKQQGGAVRVEEAESLIREFLDRSHASLGGTKSLVEQSGEGGTVLRFMTHLNQVGQTGATPRHPKGLSTCCHGEEPHVVGWRFIQERRAVNLDPACGWARGKADVLYVADAFEVMAKVNELLARE